MWIVNVAVQLFLVFLGFFVLFFPFNIFNFVLGNRPNDKTGGGDADTYHLSKDEINAIELTNRSVAK